MKFIALDNLFGLYVLKFEADPSLFSSESSFTRKICQSTFRRGHLTRSKITPSRFNFLGIANMALDSPCGCETFNY